METNELRIGNWLKIKKDYFNLLCQETPFLTDKFEVKAIKNNIVSYNLESDYDMLHISGADIDKVEPIQLSKEWLIGFGFEQYRDTLNFSIDVGIYYTANNTPKNSKLKIRFTNAGNWRVENFANKSIYLHHVHDLQNLYFAMCKKELKLTK